MTAEQSVLKSQLRVSLVLAIILLLLASSSVPVAAEPLEKLPDGSAPPASNNNSAFTKLDLIANIETIGVIVSGASLPKTAQLMYRQSRETDWRPAHPLMRIDDGRLVGSLFGLAPATAYDIKAMDGSTEITGSVTTQPDELQFTPSAVLHVNDDAAPGGNGSASAPFRSIREALNKATPGTQVLVSDGIYHETATFNTSGSAGNWIQVRAEGSGAILDGSKTISGNVWKADPSRSHVWFIKLGTPTSYVARNGQRYYKYDDIAGLSKALGHNKIPMAEGWYFEPATSTLYVRSQDHPSNSTWQVADLNDAGDTSGHDWLWIEGFEMRFYGAQYGGCGVCMQNASHVVIRRNKIHNMQLGVFINWTSGNEKGNDSRIEFNEIYDPFVNEWSWSAVKGSSMEGTGIVIRGHRGAIVRENNIHHFFNGIYTGSSGALENSELALDADIYNNHIHHISDDALEPEGACINQRFRNNNVDASFVGISLAPITQGPTWVLRSVFSNFTGRGIKWDGKSDGIVLIYHNTSWTNAKDINGMDLISPIHNAVMRNNIFQVNGLGFEEVRTGSTGNDWNNDNWYITRTSTSSHFKWENVLYSTTAKLCTSTGLECSGYETAPGFANPSGGDFTLLTTSPNIDRGFVIPGINDNFTGAGPDVGAFESTFVLDTVPKVLSSKRADANPTGAERVNFTVTFSESVTGVDTVAPFPDFALVIAPGIIGASITNVTSISGTTYTVSVSTGSGAGTIRLDVIDNDSIIDSGDQPLGGKGTGNGSFGTGEAYTVEKSSAAAKTETFASNSTYDGSILESGENSNAGGTVDKAATIINVGDDQKDRQYRGILSFNTDSLPDDATVISAQVRIKRQGVVGTDPFGTHGPLLLEINNPAFGNNVALQAGDFTAPASPGSVQGQLASQTFSWYVAELTSTNLGFINRSGTTQFRLLFSKDDNDDLGSDYVKFFSANSTPDNKPQLIIAYTIRPARTEADNQRTTVALTGVPTLVSVSMPENTTVIPALTTALSDVTVQNLTYSITGGADSSLFRIDASTGEVSFTTAPDYESPKDAGADNTYNVAIQASDGSISDTQDIAVTVSAINDSNPVMTSNNAFSIAESTTAVSTIIATDADLPAQTLTYSIVAGADSSRFNIDPATGALAFVSAPDFEAPTDAGSDNTYNVTVQVSDGSLSATQDLISTVTATNDNHPLITSNGGAASATLSIPENTTAVATVTATDADLPAQALTYSIAGGADSALFAINSSTGELTFISTPDYEAPVDPNKSNLYSVTVQASDGTLIAKQDITVAVTAVNDNTPVISSPGSASIPENTSVVATIAATDADLPAQTPTYSIAGGSDAALFSVNSSTGELLFTSSPDYELPADTGRDNTYNVTLQVSDGSLTATQDVLVSITPLNDNAPLMASGSALGTALTVSENTSAVTTVAASDSDLPAQTLTYSIVGGADSALFTLNSATAELAFVTAPDFEAPTDGGSDNIYNLTVQASDGDLVVSQDLVVTVAAANDNLPVITSASTFSVPENNSTVAAVTATDSDLPAQTLAFAIAGGTDSSLFKIDPSTGELAFVTPADYEAPTDSGLDNTYNVTVQASDGTLSTNQDLTITVTPINDNTPVITSLNTFTITENTTSVITVTATDADLPTQALIYSITGGSDATLFNLNSSTGELTFIVPPDFEVPTDAGQNNIYNLTLEAADEDSVCVQDILVTLSDVIE